MNAHFSRIKMAVNENNHIVLARHHYRYVYVCDNTGLLKYKPFKLDSDLTKGEPSLSITDKYEIMITSRFTRKRTAKSGDRHGGVAAKLLANLRSGDAASRRHRCLFNFTKFSFVRRRRREAASRDLKLAILDIFLPCKFE